MGFDFAGLRLDAGGLGLRDGRGALAGFARDARFGAAGGAASPGVTSRRLCHMYHTAALR